MAEAGSKYPAPSSWHPGLGTCVPVSSPPPAVSLGRTVPESHGFLCTWKKQAGAPAHTPRLRGLEGAEVWLPGGGSFGI